MCQLLKYIKINIEGVLIITKANMNDEFRNRTIYHISV